MIGLIIVIINCSHVSLSVLDWPPLRPLLTMLCSGGLTPVKMLSSLSDTSASPTERDLTPLTMVLCVLCLTTTMSGTTSTLLSFPILIQTILKHIPASNNPMVEMSWDKARFLTWSRRLRSAPAPHHRAPGMCLLTPFFHLLHQDE